MRLWQLHLAAILFGAAVAPMALADSHAPALAEPADAAAAASSDLAADPLFAADLEPTLEPSVEVEVEIEVEPVADAAPAMDALEDSTASAQTPNAEMVDPETQTSAEAIAEAPLATTGLESDSMASDDGFRLINPTSEGADSPASTPSSSASAIELGPLAVDAEGQVGRIHTVASGDTLWDISAAYLGTPWVWPSVWDDNDEIANPHRINPGDHIWITSGLMRIVTPEEADEMISAVPGELAAEPIPDEVLFDEAPAAPDEGDLMEAAIPASMDQLPVAVPLEKPATHTTGAMVRVSEAESLGFVAPEMIDAAASIVGSPAPRTWLADGDSIYIGLGEGDVQPGDEFTMFRDADPVRDLDGSLLGYHVEVLGWAVVREVSSESSTAEIRMSQSEIRRGDRVVPRNPININVPVRNSPDGVPGNIVYMPDSRTTMGDGEWVYLNRGRLHGIEAGTQIEAYDAGRRVEDETRGLKVTTPDHVVAQLIVVDVQPDSCVAYIVHSQRELEVGDLVRPKLPKLASR